MNVDFREITLDLKNPSLVKHLSLNYLQMMCVKVEFSHRTSHITIMRGHFLNLDLGLKCYIGVRNHAANQQRTAARQEKKTHLLKQRRY